MLLKVPGWQKRSSNISLISFTKILNNLHPYVITTFKGKDSVMPIGRLTLNLIFSYIFFNKEINFPTWKYSYWIDCYLLSIFNLVAFERFLFKSPFTWDPKWTQTGWKLKSLWKIFLFAISLWQRANDSFWLINLIRKCYQW